MAAQSDYAVISPYTLLQSLLVRLVGIVGAVGRGLAWLG